MGRKSKAKYEELTSENSWKSKAKWSINEEEVTEEAIVMELIFTV